MIHSLFILALAEGMTPSQLIDVVGPLVLIGAIFYFVMWAPMRKRQKRHEALLAALKKGDKVVTNGGLYGTVAGVDDRVVILKLGDNVKVRVARSAIAGLEGQEEAEGAKR